MITQLIEHLSSPDATSAFYPIMDTLYCIACAGLTLFFLLALRNRMPADQGRAFAVNGALSKGKTRGVGLLFIMGFVIATFLFVPLSWEVAVVLILLLASMLTGFLDDAGSTPWSGLKKGLLDLVISLGAGFAAWGFYGSTVSVYRIFGSGLTPHTLDIPAPIYIILAAALVWGSINVVNCTDGVDGLCTSLTLVALTGFAFLGGYASGVFSGQLAVGFALCLIPYLWFNASPSTMLMGDAGSRAIGLFLAMLALRSGHVLCYIPFCLVFILDGGLGLLKLALLRSVKIHILKNTRTPLHDHARKNLQWADAKTVFRFVIVQAGIIFLTFALFR